MAGQYGVSMARQVSRLTGSHEVASQSRRVEGGDPPSCVGRKDVARLWGDLRNGVDGPDATC